MNLLKMLESISEPHLVLQFQVCFLPFSLKKCSFTKVSTTTALLSTRQFYWLCGKLEGL